MFQPISFNVIRQALRWHDFPVPKFRQLSYSPPNEDGLATAEYLATWSHSLIDDHYRLRIPRGSSRAEIIYRDLLDCFMDDIQILNVGYDFALQNYTALIYVIVPTVIDSWFQFVNG